MIFLDQFGLTMLNGFNAFGNAYSLFSDPSMPAALAECFKLLPLPVSSRDATLSVGNQLMADQDPLQFDEIDWRKGKELDEDIQAAFDCCHEQLKMQLGHWSSERPMRCFPLPSLLIDGIRYYDHFSRTPGNSLVFFLSSTGNFEPGKIRQIFWIPVDVGGDRFIKAFFFAIHRYIPLSPSSAIQDPFREYPSFKAGLWTEAVSHDVEVVRSNEHICHAIKQEWLPKKGEESGVSVFKQLSRVGE
jgi:hypothetical protein